MQQSSEIPSSHPYKCPNCHLATQKPVIPMYAPYTVRDLLPNKTYLWCSCGQSKSQPFCDGSHNHYKDPEGRPYFLPVPFQVKEIQSFYSLCGCKYTQSPPFCDATHISLNVNPRGPPCQCNNKLNEW